MSVRSYLQAKKKGVTGPNTATCLPAALDCLFYDKALPVGAYPRYEDAYWEQQEKGSSRRRTRKAFKQLMRAAGGGSFKRLKAVRATNPSQCVRWLGKWRRSQRIVVYVEDLHVVGLRPVSGGFRMVGTWLPRGVSTHDVFNPSEIFTYLAQPARYKGKKLANMLAFSL